jgi:acetyltransferase
MGIEALSAAGAAGELAALVHLLQNAVDDGASVGFLPPLAVDEGMAYWRTVLAAIQDGSRILVVARDEGGHVVGSAQLDLARMPNGRHRAEVQKVMVHTKARRRGIGRALMEALEGHAQRLGRMAMPPNGSTRPWAIGARE